MKNLTFSLILTLAPFWISAQHLEVEGKVKISEMEKVNTADSLVVWLPDSIMGIRDASTLFRRLIDADQDTEISVEQSPDEDTIRFIVAGSEFATMDGKTLGLGSTGGSVYIGQGAGGNIPDSVEANTYIGKDAGFSTTTGNSNTFIGHAAGHQNTFGYRSVAIGDSAFANTTTSFFATAVGYAAGMHSNSIDNTFIGYESGKHSTSTRNTFVGSKAGFRSTGNGNTIMGASAGIDTLSGNDNTFVGSGAGLKNKSASNNSFFGKSAGGRTTTGDRNTFVGSASGFSNITGARNVFVGTVSGFKNTTGNENLFIGNNVGFNNTTGSQNTFMGTFSGFSNVSGSNNVLIGHRAGETKSHGSYNVAVGDSTMLFTDSVSRVVAIGHTAGMMTQDSLSTFIGFRAGKFATGTGGTHIGYTAGFMDLGGSNTTMGAFAGNDTLTGNSNTFIGNSSGSANKGGSHNTFIGQGTGSANTSGFQNTFVGSQAGVNSTESRDNTFIGVVSGTNNSTGDFNTFVGSWAGYNNTSGRRNVFVGTNAGGSIDTSSMNVFVGMNAGRNSVSGARNVFLGDGTGFYNLSGSRNTFLGEDAGVENITGNNNTFMGQSAGYNNTSGSGNVFLGQYSGYFENGDNRLYIDNDSVTTPLIYGDFSTNYATIHGDLGINILNPDRELVVFDTDNDGDAALKLTSSNSSSREMLIAVDQTNGGFISMQTNNDLQLRTNGVTRMTVEDGGDVGIGLLDPAFPLHVSDPGTGGSPTINLVVEANTSNRPTILFSESGSTTGLNNGMSIEYNGEGTTDEMTINAVGGAPVLTVESTDNQVGIGTTNPDRELTVFDSDGNGDAVINVKDASRELFLGTNSSGISLRSLTNDDVSFWANNVRHMTIQPSGEVGIGLTDPEALLEVNSSIVKKIGGGSWTASSDRRLKQNVVDYKEGLKELLMIRPVQFRYNNISGYNTMEEHIGVIAQELQDITPHMVSTYGRDGTDYLQVDNSAMTYMLINAVKEQQILIEQLTTQNSALMTRMEALEGSIADDQVSSTPNNEKP